MNVILTNLETAGLVVRRPHPKHGRVLQTYLTEMGEDSGRDHFEVPLALGASEPRCITADDTVEERPRWWRGAS